eukprot:10979822-Karenia_brevis.AAC.1
MEGQDADVEEVKRSQAAGPKAVIRPPPGLQRTPTCIARMGRRGFDETAEKVEEIAIETLNAAAVDPTSYDRPTAVRETGSLVK